jgi:hypothetical protein
MAHYALISALNISPYAKTRTELQPDEAFLFDFTNPPDDGFATLVGKGGKLVNDFSITSPALVDNNMAIALDSRSLVGECYFLIRPD